MKALFILGICALTLASCSCSSLVRENLAKELDKHLKNTKPEFLQLIDRDKIYVFDHTIIVKKSEIERFASRSNTYNVINGAYLGDLGAMFSRRLAKVEEGKLEPINFKLYEGMKNLKIGKKYRNLLVDQKVKSPGNAWGSVLAMSGQRTGDEIEYSTAYGWAIAKTKQRFNDRRQPIGFTPDQVSIIGETLEMRTMLLLRNNLAHQEGMVIDAANPRGRRLSSISHTSALPEGINQVQILTSVPTRQAAEAIRGLTGSGVPLSRSLLRKERRLRIVDEAGRSHLVEQKFRGSKVDLKVFSWHGGRVRKLGRYSCAQLNLNNYARLLSNF